MKRKYRFVTADLTEAVLGENWVNHHIESLTTTGVLVVINGVKCFLLDALMVIVMIELSFDMFNYAEKIYSSVDIRYRIDDENAVRRQNGITNRLRASMEIFLDGMNIDEAMKGNLNTSRGVFKAKLIAALNHEFK